jgi:hypothetical protein
LREQFEGSELEDLAAAEPELFDRALARLNLLIGSEDDRVALRAVKEVLDRTLSAGQSTNVRTDLCASPTWTPRWLRRERSSSLP